MVYTLTTIAHEIGTEYSGSNIQIDGIHTLSQASSTQISFINDDKYLDDLSFTKAAAVIVNHKNIDQVPETTIALAVDDPSLGLALASRLFYYRPSIESVDPILGRECRISKNVSFGINVKISDNVTIMAGCYIGDNTVIGSDTVIYPNVSIYHHTNIGRECIVHSGAVIGADGYGYTATRDGKHIKIYQNGNVVIGDSVEIGANSTIDRATFGSTLIGSGTKIDNLVQIAHNCQIGSDCLIVSQAGLAGSTIVGDGVIVGPQSGTAGHLSIGDRAIIAARTGVTKSLKGENIYGGFPAVEHKSWLRSQAKLQRILKGK